VPTLAWIVDSSRAGFEDLGQSWSPVQPARVEIGGSATDVLLFGGGYDAGQDTNVFRTDTKGNAIYMINAATGALEWSAGSGTARSDHDLELALMNFSIPAGLRVIDIDRDGLDDRIYVGDMGGQLWRFDLINGQPRSSLGEGGVLASLGGAGAGGSPADIDLRRFYNAPDIVEIIDGNALFVAINIGSGYRAHPLNTATNDEFYSVRDFRSREVLASNVYGSESQPILTREDLPDITNDLTPDLATNAPGWRLRMAQAAGEKVLSSSLTLSNVLFFNSFTPAASANSCLPVGGLNRLYRISVRDATIVPPSRDRTIDDEPYTPEDRFVVGGYSQVPVAPMLGPDGVCSGLDCFSGEDAYDGDDGDDGDGDGDGNNGMIRVNSTYWFPDPRP
jgi:type IV pilus assembly protein PilY1